MEDYEVKRAYEIVYEDLKETCQVRNQCTNCPIKEAIYNKWKSEN